MAKEEVTPKKVSRIKVKKKSWCKILSPSIFGESEIGESYLPSAETGIGRTLKMNLRDLTGNVKDQNTYLSFQVVAARGNTLLTKAIGYELTTSYVKRIVRKSISRLDDSFQGKTAGGKKVIVKTVAITLHKTKRSVCSELRKTIMESLREELSKGDFAQFLLSLVGQKIQAALRKKLAKIYPLKELAVRMVVLVDKTGEEAAAPPAALPEKTAVESAAPAEIVPVAEAPTEA